MIELVRSLKAEDRLRIAVVNNEMANRIRIGFNGSS